MSWITLLLALTIAQQPNNAETRIVNYLSESIAAGRLVEVSELVNDVFTTPEEQAALGRLYDSFFKIPMFLVQYQASSGRPPTLTEIAEQFAFNGPRTTGVILDLMSADPRLPRFFERNPAGQITSISAQPVLDHPQFGQSLARSITGWEGRAMPSFATETFGGQPVSSDQFEGTPYMVCVWFSNCPPCVQTGPLLVDLDRQFDESDFRIIAANADDYLELPYTDTDRSAYVDRLGMEFTQAVLTAPMHDAFGGVSIFPTMFFVDRDGTVARHFVNFQERDVLEDAIESLLE